MFALGELAAHCQPEMSKHAGEALPHVFAAMAEDDATLQEQACYALDSFCENLGELCVHLLMSEPVLFSTDTAYGTALQEKIFCPWEPHASLACPWISSAAGLHMHRITPCLH